MREELYVRKHTYAARQSNRAMWESAQTGGVFCLNDRRGLEQITATAREDLTTLMKEYARVGYKAAHGQRDEGFEELWGRAFDADRAEEKPLE